MSIKRNIYTGITNVVVAMGLFSMVACGGASDESAQRPATSEEPEIKAEKHQYPMPTPLETADMLNKAGASYIIDIANPPEGADNYINESSMALNLGVYSSDLSYSAVYNKTQQTLNFFDASQKLVSGLNIEEAFEKGLDERIRENIEVPDSVHKLLTGSFEGTYGYLLNQDKGHLAVMVVAGGWIEGLYLSTELSQLTANNKEILQGIGEQKATLTKLNELLEKYAGDQTIDNLIESLGTIEYVLGNVKNENGRYSFTKEQITELSHEVQSLRMRVIGTP